MLCWISSQSSSGFTKLGTTEQLMAASRWKIWKIELKWNVVHFRTPVVYWRIFSENYSAVMLCIELGVYAFDWNGRYCAVQGQKSDLMLFHGDSGFSTQLHCCSFAKQFGEPVIPSNYAVSFHSIVHCKHGPMTCLQHNKDIMPH